MARKIDLTRATLLELCLTRTNRPLAAARIAAFVVAWGVARRELGHSPTVDEYAEFWRAPIRTAYKEQSDFRAAFPALDTPDAILDHMAAYGAREDVSLDFAGLAV